MMDDSPEPVEAIGGRTNPEGGAMIGAWWFGAVVLGASGGDPPPTDSGPPQAKAADAAP
jgi:hypothetical protein